MQLARADLNTITGKQLVKFLAPQPTPLGKDLGTVTIDGND